MEIDVEMDRRIDWQILLFIELQIQTVAILRGTTCFTCLAQCVWERRWYPCWILLHVYLNYSIILNWQRYVCSSIFLCLWQHVRARDGRGLIGVAEYFPAQLLSVVFLLFISSYAAAVWALHNPSNLLSSADRYIAESPCHPPVALMIMYIIFVHSWLWVGLVVSGQ